MFKLKAGGGHRAASETRGILEARCRWPSGLIRFLTFPSSQAFYKHKFLIFVFLPSQLDLSRVITTKSLYFSLKFTSLFKRNKSYQNGDMLLFSLSRS